MLERNTRISTLTLFSLLIGTLSTPTGFASPQLNTEVSAQENNQLGVDRAPLLHDPVDIVYTYVQPDPDWVEKKQALFKKKYNPKIHNIDCNNRCRFQNRNELKHSIQSVHKFFPFVRNIYIVTDHQI
ncbi:MAG: hypothetical protein ABIQ95_10985, partial [Bdellovibrionia bacterium]